MKAGIFFTGTGPILLLTSYESLEDPELIKKLQSKGIERYIAFGVSADKVRERYGMAYNLVMNDLSQSNDLRVLDYNGHHVFNMFRFDEMEPPVQHDR